jgi:hypothetical protein
VVAPAFIAPGKFDRLVQAAYFRGCQKSLAVLRDWAAANPGDAQRRAARSSKWRVLLAAIGKGG